MVLNASITEAAETAKTAETDVILTILIKSEMHVDVSPAPAVGAEHGLRPLESVKKSQFYQFLLGLDLSICDSVHRVHACIVRTVHADACC